MEDITGIFNRFKKRSATKLQRFDISGSTFTSWGGDAYADDLFRGAVDAIARNAAKLRGQHVITGEDGQKPGNDTSLDHILQVRPNPYMSAYDALYKMITHLYLYDNSFAVICREGRRVCGIYPVDATGVEFLVDEGGALFVRFTMSNGASYTFPYGDVVHLRRFFNSDDLIGDANDAIRPALELSNTQNQGIVNGIKSGATIRGILKCTQILSPEKLKETRDAFIADYLDVSNDGGIVTLDQKQEYTPIESKAAAIDPEQVEQVKKKVYNYLGVNESIVNSSYTEDAWSAFYESVVEPLSIQMSLEFTEKVFTAREQAFGNSIMFEANRLQFASNSTKADLITKLSSVGLLTTNQALEILNLPPVEGGDTRLQSLNYVDADKANQYQLKGATE